MDDRLTSALRGHSRRRTFRRFLVLATLPVALVAAVLFDLNRTETLICAATAIVLALIGDTEIRLKTMQVRLAGMEDKLDRLSGNEPEDNLILELSDW